jgi:hypothetical protein
LAVLGHLQVNKLFTINSSEEKTYTNAYLGVLHICGVQCNNPSKDSIIQEDKGEHPPTAMQRTLQASYT